MLTDQSIPTYDHTPEKQGAKTTWKLLKLVLTCKGDEIQHCLTGASSQDIGFTRLSKPILPEGGAKEVALSNSLTTPQGQHSTSPSAGEAHGGAG